MQGPQPKRKSITGTGPVVFSRDSFGYALDVDFGQYQLTCKGMDGGTYGVEILCLDDIWRSVATGKALADIVHIGEQFHFQQIRVTYAGLGGAAVPVATLSATGRHYAWG